MSLVLADIVQDFIAIVQALGLPTCIVIGIGLGLWYGIPAVWVLVVRSAEKKIQYIEAQILRTESDRETQREIRDSIAAIGETMRAMLRIVSQMRGRDNAPRPILMVVEDNQVEAIRTKYHCNKAVRGANLAVMVVSSIGDAFFHLHQAAGVVLDIELGEDAPLAVVKMFIDEATDTGRFVIVYSGTISPTSDLRAYAVLKKSGRPEELVEKIQEAMRAIGAGQ